MRNYIIRGLIFPFLVQAKDEDGARAEVVKLLGPFINCDRLDIQEWFHIPQEYIKTTRYTN